MPNQQQTLSFLYTTLPGRAALSVLTKPALSSLVGKTLSTTVSARAVEPFVQAHRMDLSRFEQKTYASYNDFFTRRLASPPPFDAQAEDALCSPCDARLAAFPITGEAVFRIKQTPYRLEDLLDSKALAAEFCGGVCLIFRLCVEDYHRYHYFDAGVQGESYSIPGVLHTVNPVALGQYNIYKTNSRAVTVLETAHFGTAVQVEVGAMMVGKIVNLRAEGDPFARGEEKGYFEFGGSTVVVLLQRGSCYVAKKYFTAGESGREIRVRVGERIGRAAQCAEASGTDKE